MSLILIIIIIVIIITIVIITCQLIDMSVPSDSNISVKEFEKLGKYKDLEFYIAKMWKMKTKP